MATSTKRTFYKLIGGACVVTLAVVGLFVKSTSPVEVSITVYGIRFLLLCGIALLDCALDDTCGTWRTSRVIPVTLIATTLFVCAVVLPSQFGIDNLVYKIIATCLAVLPALYAAYTYRKAPCKRVILWTCIICILGLIYLWLSPSRF